MQTESIFVPELSWKENELPQKERTKHVHGLHPYLGKYVPQLVDYLIERYSHDDKKFLKRGNIILDPFAGSGTTLIEANLHNMASIGVDISAFNILLCSVKIPHEKYKLELLKKEFRDIVGQVKARVRSDSDNERLDDYLQENPIADRYSNINIKETGEYLRTWYHPDALYPLLVFRELIAKFHYQDALKILLSRVARSSRLAPHYELDFPLKPFTKDYYCYKHARLCHPTTNAIGFMERYELDTYSRLAEFQKIRKDYDVTLIHEDSRTLNYNRSNGVITSPPYVGLIDYHEQHRYAYELLGLTDQSEKEIGSKKNRNGKKAVESYRTAITQVIRKIANESTNGPIIFVVNDRYQLYDSICQDAGVKIIERLKRRVDRRTGRRSNGDFYEDIIVMKSQ